MSPKRGKSTRKPRGAQKWILAELRSLGAGAQLSTSQLAKRIEASSKKSFHKNSVYNALRILVRNGAIRVAREGHEKMYRIGSAVRSVKARLTPAVEMPTVTPVVETLLPSGTLPHKLALGEILVLSVNDGIVTTATNLHGKLVVERHPL
jgi:hypothetical protein